MTLYGYMVSMAKRGKEGLRKRAADWWDGKRDSHLAILSTVFAACCVLLVAALAQFLFLQDVEGFADYTGPAWIILVITSLIAIFIGPEFFHYIAQRGILMDALKMDSRSEISKVRAEVESAARLLGSGAEERLNEHFSSLGLKKIRR